MINSEKPSSSKEYSEAQATMPEVAIVDEWGKAHKPPPKDFFVETEISTKAYEAQAILAQTVKLRANCEDENWVKSLGLVSIMK